MNDSNHQKMKCRWKSAKLQDRGVIQPRPCEVCGDDDVHRHHDDYNNAYDVRWLCEKHHLELHGRIMRSEDERARRRRMKAIHEMFHEELPKLDGHYRIRIPKEVQKAISKLSWVQSKFMRREFRQVLDKWATLALPNGSEPKPCDNGNSPVLPS